MLPAELTDLDQWVCAWDNSKVPMQATVKKAASSSDPATWSSYQVAAEAVKKGRYDYVGFVFNNNGIIGIDIDCGYDEDGFFSHTTVDIAKNCRSYMEKSKSGRGVHIFVKGTLPFSGRNNLQGVEIYQAKRYFIMTGDTLIYNQIIENQSAIDYVLNAYFNAYTPSKTAPSNGNGRIYTPTYKRPQNGRISLTREYSPIPNGARNISLTSLAGQLRISGYSKDDIYQELLRANQAACHPPLDEQEVLSITNSIMRYKN